MLIASSVLFGGGLLGLVGLFTIKYLEQHRGSEFPARWRARADSYADEVKIILARARHETTELLPKGVMVLRIGIHKCALWTASFARLTEKQAHRLADMASHKHHFQYRETRSDFLKQVSDYKRR